VTGMALDPNTDPSCFESINLTKDIDDRRVDIRDKEAVEALVVECDPDFIFHLAAQPLVRLSYADPVGTAEINVLGMVNLLNAMRRLEKDCVAVLITSDKSYRNDEVVWGYRESDQLGGSDPYSGSKGAAELMINAFQRSFFPDNGSVRIGVARAGNVIGGGDWNIDRLVPDCIRSWTRGEEVKLRNPNSTRPWQHVLEPLGGYMLLAANLRTRKELHGEAFNFGPNAFDNYSVQSLVESLAMKWGSVKWSAISERSLEKEAGLLKLNCDKALFHLSWRPRLTFEQTLDWTATWYLQFLASPEASREIMLGQIADYEKIFDSDGTRSN